MSKDLLKSFQEAYRNLELLPWFATRTRTEEKSITTEGTYENNIFKIISTKLKVDSTVRHEIKQ